MTLSINISNIELMANMLLTLTMRGACLFWNH